MRTLAFTVLVVPTFLATSGFVSAPVVEPAADAAAAIRESIAALRNNDLAALLKLNMTQSETDELKSAWTSVCEEPVTDQDREEFAMQFQMITAEGAEDSLMQMIEPQLAEFEPSLEMMLGMVGGMAGAQLAGSGDLSQAEKDKSQQMINRFTQFLGEADLLNRDKIRSAVGVVCGTARALELTTLDELRKLSLDQALAKGGVVLGGVKKVLGVYGISIDAVLDSVEIETVEAGDTEATLKLSFEFLGEKDSTTAKMVLREGRWTRASN